MNEQMAIDRRFRVTTLAHTPTIHRRRTGLTLLEVLVVIAIIGLLLAIIMPAVLSSREAARKLECLSNVRQIAIAASNYAVDHEVFPPSSGLDKPSYLVRLLPYLDATNLYNKFDLNEDMSKQFKLAELRPGVMACPSDWVVADQRYRPSYFGNGGWHVPVVSTTGFPETRHNGVISFMSRVIVGPQHVNDGLSQTAIISEFLPTVKDEPERAMWVGQESLPLWGRPAEVMARECLSFTRSIYWSRGNAWVLGGYGETIYNHVLPPNSRNCTYVYNAGSLHDADGVNVAMCDGSARFVTSSIDPKLWRAYGTRNGNESVVLP